MNRLAIGEARSLIRRYAKRKGLALTFLNYNDGDGFWTAWVADQKGLPIHEPSPLGVMRELRRIAAGRERAKRRGDRRRRLRAAAR